MSFWKIVVHTGVTRGLYRNFNECVGAGRANEGLRVDLQWQLRMAKDELGFRYIRMYGLLCDDMGVYSEDNKGSSVYKG